MDGKIYIIQAASQSLTVFRSEDNCFEAEIKNERFNKLQDIVACYGRSKLYILDQSCIWQLDRKGNVSVYAQLSHVSAGMSIRRRNLLVTSSSALRKYAYKRIGRPSPSEIRLPVGLLKSKAWHALELDDGYVIAHVERGIFHRVTKIEESQVNRVTLEISSYGSEAGERDDQLSNPVYLALEPKHGHVFVADHDNRRVVVLDRNLRRVLLISDLPAECHPTRLCYVEQRCELCVGLSDGSVTVYKFTR